jgi:hypothetical protein
MGNQPAASPNVANYLISKGYLMIAKWTNGVVGAYADVGNCTKFEQEPTEQSVDHFSSRNAVKEQDQEIVIQQGYNLSFTLDEVSVENMRMFMKATLVGTRILYGNMNSNQLYAVKFMPTNEVGPTVTHEYWKVKITPNGPFSLIGDEYTSMSFSGKGLADRGGHPLTPFFTASFETTTTTTTTTTTAA